MIIGIMSDTHDRLPMIDAAVNKLNELGVELVYHAGDYIAPFVDSHLKNLKAPLIGVLGNNDGSTSLLKQKFAEFGADIRGRFAFDIIDGLRIAIVHGDDRELMRSLLELQSHDILITGHTHEAKIYRKGQMLVINPGETCGLLTGKSTIAILDTEKLEAEIIELNK
ncbi:MAG: metallophosphoesterase [Candidatus Bathyarchaeota archaeon]|nr:MAG: metallophosphoesterase [Candidatus Bathyarchaeum tardum]WNZ28577.1 MAG: metallophosphoesterase [Candidatus Bathyarchaeota archaeon]